MMSRLDSPGSVCSFCTIWLCASSGLAPDGFSWSGIRDGGGAAVSGGRVGRVLCGGVVVCDPGCCARTRLADNNAATINKDLREFITTSSTSERTTLGDVSVTYLV